VLQHFAVFNDIDMPLCPDILLCVLQSVAECCRVLQSVAECCRVLQSVAECCSVLQCVTVCCSVLQYVAVCCRVLQCVAVYYGVPPSHPERWRVRACQGEILKSQLQLVILYNRLSKLRILRNGIQIINVQSRQDTWLCG